MTLYSEPSFGQYFLHNLMAVGYFLGNNKLGTLQTRLKEGPQCAPFAVPKRVISQNIQY